MADDPKDLKDEAPAGENGAAELAEGLDAADAGDEDLFDFDDEDSAPAAAAADEAPAGEAAPDEDAPAAASDPLSGSSRMRERRRGMRWYVIHANTGHENKVKRNIEMAIKSNHMATSSARCWSPTQEVTEMKNGKRSTSKRKFFPSYILVEMVDGQGDPALHQHDSGGDPVHRRDAAAPAADHRARRWTASWAA